MSIAVSNRNTKKNCGLRFTILACFALTACNSIPERDPNALDIQLPAQWRGDAHASEPIAISWLKMFNDTQLTAMVKDGLANNFELKSASARVDAAREQAVIAGANRLPQVFFSPSYQRSKNSDGSGTSEFGAFTALFDFNWELDVWGRIKAGQQAATEDALATDEDYRAAQLSMAARIAQVYFEWIEAQLQADVATQSVKDRSIIVNLVSGRFNKGLTKGLDLRLVLTDLSNAQAQLAQTNNDVQSLARRLQTLLARYPDGELNLKKSLPQPPHVLTSGLPSELLTRRPDVVAAFKRLCAADSRSTRNKKIKKEKN